MTHYSVDTDQLEARINEMAAFERTVERHLADLDRRIAALHVTWLGDAATAHRRAHAEWKKGAEDLKQAVAAMRKAAQIAHGNYHSAVHANTAMWNSVR